MTSSQGTEYYLKSMNGIKSFDDGSGTVIEDDSITVANLTSSFISCETFENTGTFYTLEFSANTVSTSYINSALGNLTVSGDITTSGTIYAGNLGITGPMSAGSLTTNTITATSSTSNVNLYSGSTGSVSLGGYGDIIIGDKQKTNILLNSLV